MNDLRSLFPRNSWRPLLESEFDESYWKLLEDAVAADIPNVFPALNRIFRAFELTRPEQVKVVILGQDPYHTKGAANGLCFSVTRGTDFARRSSLVNILREVGVDQFNTEGDLESWAKQGVLLLNSALTVRASEPGSHSKYWAPFTDRVIQAVAHFFLARRVVFMLWGTHARSKRTLIGSRHLILETSHPCKYSASKGFIGSDHFNKANEFLRNQNEGEINWKSIETVATNMPLESSTTSESSSLVQRK